MRSKNISVDIIFMICCFWSIPCLDFAEWLDYGPYLQKKEHNKISKQIEKEQNNKPQQNKTKQTKSWKDYD